MSLEPNFQQAYLSHDVILGLSEFCSKIWQVETQFYALLQLRVVLDSIFWCDHSANESTRYLYVILINLEAFTMTILTLEDNTRDFILNLPWNLSFSHRN